MSNTAKAFIATMSFFIVGLLRPGSDFSLPILFWVMLIYLEVRKK